MSSPPSTIGPRNKPKCPLQRFPQVKSSLTQWIKNLVRLFFTLCHITLCSLILWILFSNSFLTWGGALLLCSLSMFSYTWIFFRKLMKIRVQLQVIFNFNLYPTILILSRIWKSPSYLGISPQCEALVDIFIHICGVSFKSANLPTWNSTC